MLFYFEKVDLRINGPFHNCDFFVLNQDKGWSVESCWEYGFQTASCDICEKIRQLFAG